MKNIIKIIIISFLYSLFAFTNSYSIENKILFKVNNNIVTSLDILAELRYLKIINKDFDKITQEEIFEISKNSLIREKIKEIEIKKVVKDFRIKDKTLNNVLLNYFKEFGINSMSEFERFFLKKDIDPNFIRKKISIEILWNQLIFSKYNKSLKIDKQSIRNSLLEDTKQTEFLLSEILFSINENENLNEKFSLIKDTIKKTDFAQAALTFSISDTANKGGKLGWITESILSKNIYKELKYLKVGEYTKPILVPGGFLILKLLDAKEVEKKLDIDKEIEKIVQSKTNRQLNRFSNIYFNKAKKEITINEL